MGYTGQPNFFGVLIECNLKLTNLKPISKNLSLIGFGVRLGQFCQSSYEEPRAFTINIVEMRFSP